MCVITLPHVFGKPKVCDFDMAIPVQQNIFWLYVSEDNFVSVQVVQCQNDF